MKEPKSKRKYKNVCRIRFNAQKRKFEIITGPSNKSCGRPVHNAASWDGIGSDAQIAIAGAYPIAKDCPGLKDSRFADKPMAVESIERTGDYVDGQAPAFLLLYLPWP